MVKQINENIFDLPLFCNSTNNKQEKQMPFYFLIKAH